jgi:hypothetical protein
MKKDGHTDVASSLRMCKTIIEDANDIVNALPQDMEASLPTWWTNKLAKCSAMMNGARDYLVYSTDTPSSTSMPFTLEEIPADQVVVGDFKSKHFDICPSAVALYKDIEVSDEAIESAMLHDMLFKVEKKAIAADTATQEEVDKTQHYADMIMKIAEEMDLEEEHSYIEDVHMAKMKELADKDTEEEEDDMLPPSAKMVQMGDC